jgi:hypothetical protein
MNTDELKHLWKSQPAVEQPSQALLMEKALDYKKKTKLRLVFSLVCLALTFLFIAWIGYCIEPEWISTRIGLVLVLLAIVVYLGASGQALTLFGSAASADLTAGDYLRFLLAWKEKQRFLQETLMTVYFLMLSGGLALYMLEYAHRMGLLGGLVAYGLTTAWIGFNWFYIRPKTIQKQRAKTEELIIHFEKLSKQFAD